MPSPAKVSRTNTAKAPRGETTVVPMRAKGPIDPDTAPALDRRLSKGAKREEPIDISDDEGRRPAFVDLTTSDAPAERKGQPVSADLMRDSSSNHWKSSPSSASRGSLPTRVVAPITESSSSDISPLQHRRKPRIATQASRGSDSGRDHGPSRSSAGIGKVNVNRKQIIRDLVEDLGDAHTAFVKDALASGASGPAIPAHLIEFESPLKHFDSSVNHVFGEGVDTHKISIQTHIHKSPVRWLDAPVTRYESVEDAVPAYKTHIPTVRNILTEDEHELRYVHYFGDLAEEDTVMFSEHFENRVEDLPEIHMRTERAARLVSAVKLYLKHVRCPAMDIVHYLIGDILEWEQTEATLFTLEMAKKARASVAMEDAQRNVIKSNLPYLSPRQIDDAVKTCDAFERITDMALWDVVKLLGETQLLMGAGKSTHVSTGSQPSHIHSESAKVGSVETYTSLGCLVCKMHECPEHGKSGEKDKRRRIIGDSETAHSRALAELTNTPDNSSTPIERANEGTLTNDVSCSDSCFFARANRRTKAASKWSKSQEDLLTSTMPAYRQCRNAPCRFTPVIEKSCNEIYLKMCQIDPDMALENFEKRRKTTGVALPKSRRALSKTDWADGNTHRHEERKAFKPLLNRECDPDLCGSCGAIELLDPENRDKIDEIKNACHNVNLQLGASKHTFLGTSEVDGYGLFMGEPAKPKDFLGEYTGEVISRAECERRGVVYHELKLSYIFRLNAQQDVDATRAGNKLRFINHANADGRNCQPKVLMVNGVHRIAMFTTKEIYPGDEIFFDYGPYYTKNLVSKSARNLAKSPPPHVARHVGAKGDGPSKPKLGKKGGPRPGAGRKPRKAMQARAETVSRLETLAGAEQARKLAPDGQALIPDSDGEGKGKQRGPDESMQTSSTTTVDSDKDEGGGDEEMSSPPEDEEMRDASFGGAEEESSDDEYVPDAPPRKIPQRLPVFGKAARKSG
ncbi:MAG: hypothetical protein M1833_001507 [Piccolia ochrophora]|nr:MAG: hypothetical protein M1833_001507 [Piccolia ochrophora]